MGYLDGFGVTIRQHREFGGDRPTRQYSGGRVARRWLRREGKDPTPRPADLVDDDKAPKPERLHGRHVLNRYEDGMEKCIGCELCAGVCPAKCIYVRGADNDLDNPTSPGERFGFVYEINYLRCIHCDLCVEACPTEAITESKLFEFSFTNRQDAIYTKAELVVDDDGRPQHLPWEDWREGEDADTSGVDAGDVAERRRPSSSVGSAGAASSATASRAPEPADAVRPRHRRDEPGRERSEPETPVELIVFVIASAMVLGGAIGVVAYRNPVHAALSLVLTLFGVAVHFVAQEAHFLAAVQVIVYAGAIVVLFLFVIMLLGVDTRRGPARRPAPDPAPAGGDRRPGIVGLLIAAIVAGRDDRSAAAGERPRRRPADRDGDHDANIKQLADNLFGAHVFAFEFTVGAAHRRRRRHRACSRAASDAAVAATARRATVVNAAVVATAPAPTPTWYLVLGAVLFGIGVVGVLVRRNPLVLFMCIELMLNAVNLTFVALAVRLGNIDGQTAVFFVLVVAAAEVVVGLGIIVSILRRRPAPPTTTRADGTPPSSETDSG